MDASTLLLEAVREAREDDALLSFVYNELAWLKMERLDVAKAREYFTKAKESCENLVENGQFIFKTRLYHIRHGLAMAERPAMVCLGVAGVRSDRKPALSHRAESS